jgi:hypothetical protein
MHKNPSINLGHSSNSYNIGIGTLPVPYRLYYANCSVTCSIMMSISSNNFRNEVGMRLHYEVQSFTTTYVYTP